MTNRRQFLAGSLAGSTLITAFPAGATTLFADPARNLFADIVFDERFEHAVRIARDFGKLGTRAYAIQGDVSEVWYEQLAPSFQAGPRTIGGLTSAGGEV